MRECGFRGDRKDLLFLLKSILVLLILALVFYDTPAAAICLAPLIRPICVRSRKQDDEERRRELIQEFKECMSSVLTAMKSGNSAENSFRYAQREMEFAYGRGSAICQELELISRGLDSNVSLEVLLSEFADRSGAEEICDFAEVFAIAKRSGGNMTEIMSRTISQIQNRIEVEQEIAVMMSSSRLEQRIMDVVPVGIIVYLRLTSDGFMDVLYRNAFGILVMSICMLVYLAAYLMSEKISDIPL